MGMYHDRVRIKLIRAFQSSNGSVNYTKDSELLVDPATADALLFAGIAVKISETAGRVGEGGSKPPSPPGERG
jgi:hypothetical protein